jgi:hypothetical protein
MATGNGRKAVYGPSPIKPKRHRRTKAEMAGIREGLHAILKADHPQTVRGTFYQATVQKLVAKTEKEYKQTIGRLLVDMRLSKKLPFDWIADNTRWMRKPNTYSSLEDALWSTSQGYRRALWDNQDVYVEVWTEKDALAGVLLEETRRWDVPLMVSRGFSSITYLYEAAQAIAAEDKPAYVYHFGDHDPSGVAIDRVIERRLREFAPDAEIHFERVAVTPEQIRKWKLPTRPTKKTDSRSKGFKGESVEVDAIPAARLRQLVSECILRHVDQRQLEVLRVAERSEREILKKISRSYRGGDEEE